MLNTSCSSDVFLVSAAANARANRGRMGRSYVALDAIVPPVPVIVIQPWSMYIETSQQKRTERLPVRSNETSEAIQ